VLQLLLKHPRVNIEMESKWRWRPLDTCASAEAARALLDAGATLSAPAPGCMSALHHAVFSSRDDVVDVLLSRGANVREKFAARAVKQAFNLDLEGEALHLAAYGLRSTHAIIKNTGSLAALGAPAGVLNAHRMATRRVAVVNALLRAGADVTATATGREQPSIVYYPMPLHLAALAGDAAVIRALLAGGAPVDARESSMSTTALIFAANEGHTDAIYALAAGGADVNARACVGGITQGPLDAAIVRNRPAAATALLELGANTSIVARYVASPMVDDAVRAVLNRYVTRGRTPLAARECAMPGCEARRRAFYGDAKLMICGACKVRLSLWAHDAHSGTDSLARRPWRTAARSISASTGLRTRRPAMLHATRLEARCRPMKWRTLTPPVTEAMLTRPSPRRGCPS
jgi:ankyrin repeat protein